MCEEEEEKKKQLSCPTIYIYLEDLLEQLRRHIPVAYLLSPLFRSPFSRFMFYFSRPADRFGLIILCDFAYFLVYTHIVQRLIIKTPVRWPEDMDSVLERERKGERKESFQAR